MHNMQYNLNMQQCAKYAIKYAKLFAICRTVTSPDFAYSAYVCTPDFADEVMSNLKISTLNLKLAVVVTVDVGTATSPCAESWPSPFS